MTPLELSEQINTVIEANTTLSASSIILDARINPRQVIDKVFSVAMSTKNSEFGRKRERIIANSRVSITFINKINPNNQTAAQSDAYTLENEILKAMMVSANFPECQANYIESTRQLSQNRDFLVTTMVFEISHQWDLS